MWAHADADWRLACAERDAGADAPKLHDVSADMPKLSDMLADMPNMSDVRSTYPSCVICRNKYSSCVICGAYAKAERYVGAYANAVEYGQNACGYCAMRKAHIRSCTICAHEVYAGTGFISDATAFGSIKKHLRGEQHEHRSAVSIGKGYRRRNG